MALKRALLLCVLIAASLAVWLATQATIPEAWNPWATLRLESQPNWLTRSKLARLTDDDAQCHAVLATSAIDYGRMPNTITGEACGYFNAVRIEGTSAGVGTPFALTCRTAVSFALWERHVLQPTARKHYGVPVAKIEHFGSYSCRNVYGRPNATRSRHATAEAFDVAGFVLTDGRRIRIINDWDGEHAPFLRELRDGACRFFDAVLSPDYNAAHRDHFHLDRGGYRVCR